MRIQACVLLCKLSNFNYRGSLFNPDSSAILSLKRVFSQWHLVSAVCLERKPVITQPLTLLEQKYFKYLQDLEVEKSFLSDHEKRQIEDQRVAEKIKTGDIEEVDIMLKQTAQDFEDACLEEFNKYKPNPRITDADLNNNQKSIERKLDSSLLLVVKQKLGNDYRWILPQAVHQDGETLRQTAERALIEVCSSKPANVNFMGNSPVGYYKYKYPKVVRGNGICGAKVFFFKAQLLGSIRNPIKFKQTEETNDHLWLTHSELIEFLQPVYYKAVQSFLFPDTLDVELSNTFEPVIDQTEFVSRSSALGQT